MDIASEYRYRNPVVGPGDLVIGITQSGETADTLAAMRLARERGAHGPRGHQRHGPQATRDADGVLYTRAGLEIGVAATKTFLCQVAVMYLLALRLAELRGTLDAGALAELVAELQAAARARSRSCSRTSERRSRRSPTRHWRRAASSSTSAATSGFAGRPRGRAEAQGDLLHLDRRLRGRRDEARPDRAARRVDAGRRRRHRRPVLEKVALEHRRRSAPAART